MKTEVKLDIQTAIFLAAVCGQTYTQLDTGNKWFLVPPTYHTVGTFTAAAIDGVQEPFGFVIESNQAVILAFRGTGTAVEWITDFIAQQAPFPPVQDGCLTHRGFTSIYMTARDRILELLQQVPSDKPLFITGHSLGGALAALAAYDIVNNCDHDYLYVYTYASPRVGDPTFVRGFNMNIPVSVRIHNKEDIVTHLPPVIYRPPRSNSTFYYSHVKGGVALDFKTGSVGGNHALSSYFADLSLEAPQFAANVCAAPPGWCPL